jgi:hypothetical protein
MATLSHGTSYTDYRSTEARATAGQSRQFRFRAFRGTLEVLDEASRIELGFPQDLYAIQPVHAIRYGGMRDRILFIGDELAA